MPVHHTVPSVGYLLQGERGSLAFSGDTGACPAFWQALNARQDLRALIIECAFPDEQKALALASRHLCPSLLAAELEQFAHVGQCDLYITHLKPGQIELTMEQIETSLGRFEPRMLQNNQILEI